MCVYLVTFRHTTQRNLVVCTSDTPIQNNEGFYSGMDLIPNPLQADGSPKKCPCGVSDVYVPLKYGKFIMQYISIFY